MPIKRMRGLSCAQLWLPDSPRWLLLSGRGRGQAEVAVERLRGKYAEPGTVRAELEEMVAANQQNQRKTSFLELFQGSNLKPLQVRLQRDFRHSPMRRGLVSPTHFHHQLQ